MTDLSQIHKIQESLNDEQIIFCYAGYITEDVLLSIGKTIRQKLEMAKAERNAARAIFAIFVEEAQNVIRYSQEVIGDENGEDGNELRRGFIAVGNGDGDYYVCCGNLIQLDDVSRLEGHLQNIKSLDEDELKALYKQILRGDVPEGSKGAGVGFVDIARKAKGRFDYFFKDINDKHAYFYLIAHV
jgi:hypothetical protein